MAAVSPATPGHDNPDAWRIALCRHGLGCKYLQAGQCSFAHSLRELRPPYEGQICYDKFWRDGVDRWYGQDLAPEQLARIKSYWKHTPLHQRPSWAWALYWYQNEEELGFVPELGEDFGLGADVSLMLSLRRGGRRPFQWLPGFWRRIELRTTYLTRLHGPHSSASMQPAVPTTDAGMGSAATPECEGYQEAAALQSGHVGQAVASAPGAPEEAAALSVGMPAALHDVERAPCPQPEEEAVSRRSQAPRSQNKIPHPVVAPQTRPSQPVSSACQPAAATAAAEQAEQAQPSPARASASSGWLAAPAAADCQEALYEDSDKQPSPSLAPADEDLYR